MSGLAIGAAVAGTALLGTAAGFTAGACNHHLLRRAYAMCGIFPRRYALRQARNNQPRLYRLRNEVQHFNLGFLPQAGVRLPYR